MQTDYSEFIARHHKGAQPAKERRKRKSRYEVFLTFMTLSLYLGIFLYVATVGYVDKVTVVVGVFAFVLATLVGFVAQRSYHLHRKQEQELELLQEVLEGSRGARLITDPADRPVYYNEKFVRLCQGVGGKTDFDALVALFQDNSEAMAHLRMLADQAHRGLTDSIELFSKVGENERWFMVAAQPVTGWPGYVHWRLDDVTARYAIERAIREEREKLIDFTDNAPVGFFSTDERGRFVFANATFARWLGEDLQTLLDSGTLHTYLVEPPEGGAPYDVVANSRERQVAEVRMKGPGGRTFLASVNQVIVLDSEGRVRTRAVVHDLTSEREIRQALKASEDRFQRFFEEAPLGIIQVDQNGVISDCNAEFSHLIGAPPEKLEGSHFEALIDEADRQKVMSALDRIGKGQQMEAPLEIALHGKGGNVVVQMHARRFKGGDNIVLHFIDVTERRHLEVQFVQSQKMQAIGQLAGGIAHDFNNLLTAMIGFCDLLLLRHKPGDPSFSDLMQIKQNSNRAANLVRQLLAFSRQQTLRPKVQDITDILTELSHLLRRLLGANIDLNLVHGQDLGLVKVDEGQMEQVLINLAVNARDAMDGGGKLTIATDNFANRKAKELISEELPTGHWVQIKVTDTGCGIPKENLSRIFEPFFTTKEVGQGTGLGLATVYGIIRQTGGYLDVESRESEGTTFTLYLPRSNEVEEDEQEQVKPEEIKEKDLTGTECILLVEDEDAVRMFSQRALSNKGYKVLAADSGEAALGLIEKDGAGQLDLLITDVVMPNMDGPTLAQRIRQSSPTLKIIFMSGYTEDKLKDYMGKDIYFLPKPFTLKQLTAKVREVLEDR